MQHKRVMQKNADGSYSQTPYVADATGKICNRRPITSDKKYTAKEASGFPFLDSSKLNSMQKDYQNANMGAEHASKTSAQNIVRAEQMTPTISKNLEEFSITLANTSDSPKTFIIGDHHGLGWDRAGYPPLSAEVIVGGTFGNRTLAMLKQITGATALMFQNMHITSENFDSTGALPISAANPSGVAGTITNLVESGKFFAQGRISETEASVSGEANRTSKIPFAQEIDGGTFRPNVRKVNDWSFIVDPLNGIEIVLPSKCQITMTTFIAKIERSYGMLRLK